MYHRVLNPTPSLFGSRLEKERAQDRVATWWLVGELPGVSQLPTGDSPPLFFLDSSCFSDVVLVGARARMYVCCCRRKYAVLFFWFSQKCEYIVKGGVTKGGGKRGGGYP